jgi:predicted RNA-binding Zn-ribbon protein involved in translation (DUF1610 family)
MMGCEVYKLDCGACGRTVTVPASDGEHRCSNCGAVLQLAWQAERETFSQQQERPKQQR